jgi:hypothetical protein
VREEQEAGEIVPKEGQTVPLAGTARIRILDTRKGSTSVSTAWTSVSRAWRSAWRGTSRAGTRRYA